jgi:hypothetical protein
MKTEPLDYLLPSGVTIEQTSPTYDPRLPVKRWQDPAQAGKSGHVTYTFLDFDENGAGDVARDANGRPAYYVDSFPAAQAAVANLPPPQQPAVNPNELPVPRRLLNSNEDIRRLGLVGFEVVVLDPGEILPLTPDQQGAAIQDIHAWVKAIKDKVGA